MMKEKINKILIDVNGINIDCNKSCIMTLFIAQENQQLLYEMIHKTPNFHVVFPEGSPIEEKNQWFRSIIEMFYKRVSPTISRDDLKLLNRNVLGYMINVLQEKMNSLNQLSSQPKFNVLKREHAPEYTSKEVQYRSLFDTPKPKTIDFSEKIDDDVITNMDELIENHKKMREQELKQFAPLPISYEMTLVDKSDTGVKILQDVPKEVLQPTVIKEKRVQFELPSDKNIYKEIENIHTKIETINDKLNELFEFIKQNAASVEANPVDTIKNQMQNM